MNQGFPGPLSPDQLAQMQSYWGGNSSSASMPDVAGPPLPPPPAAPLPPPQLDPAAIPPFNYAAYFGGGKAPAPAAAPPPPGPPPGAGLSPELQGQLDKTLGAPPPPRPGIIPDYDGTSPILGLAPPNARPGDLPIAPPPPPGAGTKTLAPVTVQGSPPPRGGSGGGGGDFGMSAIHKDLYSTFRNEQGNIQDASTIDRARSDAVAAGNAVIAQDRMDDAVRRQAEAEHQQKIFGAYQEDTQRQLDEVRNRTVDPNRLYRDSGSVALAIVGGLLGGLYQGVNKLQSNPFIDQMNKNIDRDIALQERELDRSTKAVLDRRSLLGDMRTTYKDNEYAKLQAKNLYYEGMKETIAAEAATYDSPAIQVRANQAINGVQRQQDALKLKDAAQQASARTTQAAFARAQEQRDFDNRIKLEESITHRITAERSGEKGKPSLASRFIPTGQDEHGVTGILARSPEEAAKTVERRQAREELRAEINNALKIRESEGALGRTLNRNNPDAPIQIYTPEWQTLIRQSQAALTASKNKASGLGAFDKGTEALLAKEIGDLESRGSSSDVRLRGLLAQLERADGADDQRLGGAKVRMRADESIEPLGSTTAPLNKPGSTTARREAP